MGQASRKGVKKGYIILAYFLIYVVWGSTYYFIGVALKGLSPFLLGALRFSAAGLLLLAWCWHKGEPIFNKNLIKKSAISGIILLFIDMAVVMLAQQYVSSSLVAIVASSTAIWIMALDIRMWKQNFRNLSKVIGIIIGFIGVSMLYIEQFGIDNSSNNHPKYGILLLLFGCFSWALGRLYTKYHSSTTENTNAFAGSAWQMLFASVTFWICTLINGDITNTDFQIIPTSAWFSLLYLVIFGSILAYSAYIWLLKVRPATEVATHAYVNPFVAILIGTIIGDENVSLVHVIGLVVILLGVIMISKRKSTS